MRTAKLVKWLQWHVIVEWFLCTTWQPSEDHTPFFSLWTKIHFFWHHNEGSCAKISGITLLSRIRWVFGCVWTSLRTCWWLFNSFKFKASEGVSLEPLSSVILKLEPRSRSLSLLGSPTIMMTLCERNPGVKQWMSPISPIVPSWGPGALWVLIYIWDPVNSI